MTNESSANAIIGNTLRIIASGEYHPGAELTQKMASYIIELEQKLTDMAVQLANAESKCRELAAECAGMKQLASEAYDEMVSHHDTDGLYSLDADGEQMDALIRLCDAQATIYDTLVMCETPATDAFLAEVRAQGVDAAIEHLSKKFESTGHIGVPVMALEWLAQELRKGAAL
ncbi:hypothetical protein P9430_22495 [Citrobacter freundii]